MIFIVYFQMLLGGQIVAVRASPRHLLHGVGHPLLSPRTEGRAVLLLTSSLQVAVLSPPLLNGGYYAVILIHWLPQGMFFIFSCILVELILMNEKVVIAE